MDVIRGTMCIWSVLALNSRILALFHSPTLNSQIYNLPMKGTVHPKIRLFPKSKIYHFNRAFTSALFSPDLWTFQFDPNLENWKQSNHCQNNNKKRNEPRNFTGGRGGQRPHQGPTRKNSISYNQDTKQSIFFSWAVPVLGELAGLAWKKEVAATWNTHNTSVDLLWISWSWYLEKTHAAFFFLIKM